MADPTHLDAAARQYEMQAEELSVLARRSARRVDGSSWTCARADRSREDAMSVRREAEMLTEDMRALAADLRNLAARRRAELQLSYTAEARVRAFLAAPPAEGVSPLPRTPWTGADLPPTGDPSWPSLARDLGLG